MKKFTLFSFYPLMIIYSLLAPSWVFADVDQKTQKLLESAYTQIGKTLIYDGSYQKISYPGGDVPLLKGVCSDVVIRALRAQDIDLQKLVHEDMKFFFSAYPKNWGLKRPDSNIDHRRVLNLMTYFKRHGKGLPITTHAKDYQPGDFVSWTLPGNLPHIGIVSDKKSSDGERYMIVHNIGAGTQLEDILFSFPITGHYRYF